MHVSLSLALALAASTAISSFAFAADQPAAGVLPAGAHGKPLNLDFETGTLQDWTASGEAFAGQPIEGDLVSKRRSDNKSNHQGRFWIGGFEKLTDKPTGTLTSVAFKVTHPYASFLVGGGPNPETRVEIVRADDQSTIHRVTGAEKEDLGRAVVDLRKHQGKEIFIRLVDEHTGHWGHINFDDFRFHADEPKFPQLAGKPAPPPVDVVKNAGLTPEQAAKEMTLPPGFKAQVFASEPDFAQPVAMTIDSRGRVWVAEANGYPKRQPEGQGKDRILVFEDTDGDGKSDKQTVFIEGLNLVSGMEVGFGGVWVGASPWLLFIPDKDGDLKPDGEPVKLLDGWAFQDTHETLNSFNWGPDGWLYGCHGVFTYSKVGKPGAPDKERIPLNAAIWRYHPTRHTFEVFAEGGSNQWGVDFNDHGQAFMTACVIPHLYHVIQGARYQRQAGKHFNPYIYKDIATIADHVHYAGAAGPHAGNNRSDSAGGGHAHCGAMVYLGDAFPAEYRNVLFMGNVHGNRINTDILEPSGSGYVGKHGKDFLLTNDKWSRVISIKTGPDGSVFWIDWYDKQACHLTKPEVWDRSNGRLYKISYGAPPGKAAFAAGELADAPSEKLVALQTSNNEFLVRHARRILQERGLDVATQAKLMELLKSTSEPAKRLRVLWALHALGGVNDDLVLAELKNPDAYVRAWAIQLAAEDKEVSAGLLNEFVRLAKEDPSPVVRLYLASAMQRLPVEQRWDVVAALLAHEEDAKDHNLPLMVWYAFEPLVAADPARALKMTAATKFNEVRQFAARRAVAK